jgi:copper chaperone CopZ
MNPVQPQSSGRESRIVFSRILLPISLVLAGGLSAATAGVEQVKLRVDGIQCPLCATAVERVIGNLPGVQQASLQSGPWRLEVSAQPGRSLDLPAIRKQLDKSGFPPVGDEEISAEGMVTRGARDHLTFRIPGGKEDYDLLEGAQLRALLQALPVNAQARVAIQARVHHHPASLPPSLSILSYEVETNR